MLNKAYEMSYLTGKLGDTTLDDFMNYHDIKQIACGSGFTFILKNDGSVWACGSNYNGQLGLGDTTQRNTFTQVTTNINNDVKQIACGSTHAFILKNDGTVWSCGYNTNGELGLGDSDSKNTFTQVSTNINNDVKQIACGDWHTFIIKNDGSLWACGNNSGQFGLGHTDDKSTFTQVTTNINNDVKEIATGYEHTFIIKNDGSVWACGYNDAGQLGLGKTTTTFTQVDISGVKQIACGNSHTFILKNDGSVWSCGRNNYGQLGLGDTTNKSSFTQVTGLSEVNKIACGVGHTVILKNDGSVWSCGDNQYGQSGLGATTTKTTFTKVTANIHDTKQIACGGTHTFILKNDGTVWSCGSNGGGALGLGDTTNRNVFIPHNHSNIKTIKFDDNDDLFVLKNDGYVYNQNGCRMNYQVACGMFHTFILKNDGSVWACGRNQYGQLGLGDTVSRTTFTQVNISDVKQISCGYEFTYILKNDGSLWSCGSNGNGQLGLGNNTDKKHLLK